MEALCILLKRLPFPGRYSDITSIFGRNHPTELCLIYNSQVNKIYDQQYHRLSSWNQSLLAPQQLQLYADVMHENGSPLESCFGFVDGTIRPIARPNRNFPIGNLAGPYEGRKYDSFMLADSGLLQKLQQHAQFNLQPLCVYGDPTYPIYMHLQSSFRGANQNDAQGRYKKAMSSVRVSVEWRFGLVSYYFKFVDFKKMQRI